MSLYKVEFEYLRIFKIALDRLADKSTTQTIHKKDIDTLYKNMVTKIDDKIKAEIPSFSVPKVNPITISTKEYFLNKETGLLFVRVLGKENYVAVGKLMDETRILSLGLGDLIVCVGNGWRYQNNRCIPDVSKLFAESPYSVHEDVLSAIHDTASHTK